MPNTPQPLDRLVLAVVATALFGLIAVLYPGLIPALTLCAAVFMALALILKL